MRETLYHVDDEDDRRNHKIKIQSETARRGLDYINQTEESSGVVWTPRDWRALRKVKRPQGRNPQGRFQKR